MQSRLPWHRMLLAAALLSLAPIASLSGEEQDSSFIRTWTRQTGETLQATFVGIDGENVIVQSHPDQTRYTVSLDDLSSADRGYIQSRQSQSPRTGRPAPRISFPFSNLGKALFRSSKSKSDHPGLAASSRIYGTPDFLQTDHSAGLPLSGTQYCGPVAASNSLVYLSLTGYPNLILEEDTSHNRQVTLIRALGSAAFMRTDQSGTSPWNVATGLDAFIRSRGYTVRKLEFQGWQPVPRRHTSRHQTPHVKSARDALADPKSAVLVNIGFYQADNNRYTRKDGHWITAAGFKDDHTLLAYDPSPRAGKHKSLHEISIAPLPFGALSLADWDEPVSTHGYYHVVSPYPAPHPKLTTIIDGFLILELR
jgi:hypothetical protein